MLYTAIPPALYHKNCNTFTYKYENIVATKLYNINEQYKIKTDSFNYAFLLIESEVTTIAITNTHVYSLIEI